MLELIASELKEKGFEVTFLTNKKTVKVSLTNRKPSALEVDYALMNSFEDCYTLVTSCNSILVLL